ncbi:glutathione S-transferase [Cricetibacter osteomyelitidis]|uniref:Glutathione S-transferase n=1 Tax=Cricetibacter osteomyelitidis TaxID=1521931 RepID=A0A4R2SZT6_9PAST|nr:glutathione S-transferase family protein [Cricetibacter osteomyelitidis]TCP95085.1 glutathione S-transferase [Cricetibacter osteomyelitidis]
MKLWSSTMSPFVRKVSVTIVHHNLQSQIEVLNTKAADPNAPHNQDNPLGRIPALQLQNGEWLFGSLVISEYLDSIGENSTLFPQNESKFKALGLHSLVDGIMENTMPMAVERMMRPESEWWNSRHQQLIERNQRSFRYLAERLSTIGEDLNIGTITLTALIDWYAFRENVIGYSLNDIAPELVQWAEKMNEKYTALSATKPC